MLMQQAQRMQKDMESNLKKAKEELAKLKFMLKRAVVWLK
jgi:DNA-binding protein YbaB